MQLDLTVSIISAENLSQLLPCIRSVFASTRRATMEVFVVDNASIDGTAEAVRSQFPQVHVIRNETRLGFTTNNNQVLRVGQGRYLLLLNDDTVVQDAALDRMVEFLDSQPAAGVVGGFLLNADGSHQPAYGRFPHPILEGIWPATNWSYWKERQSERPFQVDTVCGAAMMVRREVVERVGLLDADFDPIYSEEVDWCYRIKKAGWDIYVLPEARVIHFGSQTMNRIMPRKYELLLAHKILFFRKHSGTAASNLYRLTLAVSTIFKVVWWGCLAILRPGLPLGKERALLHWQLLKRIPSL